MSNLENELFEGMTQAVNRWAQLTLGKAVRYAPVDEGTLRDSALAVTGKSGDTVTATLSFNTPYAAVQHEGIGFEHPKGGQAKYLESAIKENVPRFKQELEKQRDRVLSRWTV